MTKKSKHDKYNIIIYNGLFYRTYDGENYELLLGQIPSIEPTYAFKSDLKIKTK